jgi:hypothetical protein
VSEAEHCWCQLRVASCQLPESTFCCACESDVYCTCLLLLIRMNYSTTPVNNIVNSFVMHMEQRSLCALIEQMLNTEIEIKYIREKNKEKKKKGTYGIRPSTCTAIFPASHTLSPLYTNVCEKKALNDTTNGCQKYEVIISLITLMI